MPLVQISRSWQNKRGISERERLEFNFNREPGVFHALKTKASMFETGKVERYTLAGLEWNR
jgi:hypothetical protein